MTAATVLLRNGSTSILLALALPLFVQAQVIISPQKHAAFDDLLTSRTLVSVTCPEEMKAALIAYASDRFTALGFQLDTVMAVRENPVLQKKDLAVVQGRLEQGRAKYYAFLDQSHIATGSLYLREGEIGEATVMCVLVIHRPEPGALRRPDDDRIQLSADSYAGLFRKLENHLHR